MPVVPHSEVGMLKDLPSRLVPSQLESGDDYHVDTGYTICTQQGDVLGIINDSQSAEIAYALCRAYNNTGVLKAGLDLIIEMLNADLPKSACDVAKGLRKGL